MGRTSLKEEGGGGPARCCMSEVSDGCDNIRDSAR